MNKAGEKQITELKHLSDKVSVILDKYPRARNDDKFLIVMVLKEFYGVHTIEDLMLPRVPCLESIRRSRQRLQEEGIYRPLEVTAKIRENREEVMRSYARRDI